MTIVVADQGLLGLAEMAPSDWEIRRYDGRVIADSQLDQADALLVRSTVRLDPERLPESVRFIGTATIGTDHLPLEALAERGIQVVSAPGCNALAVTDYVLSQCMDWAASRGRDWQQLRLAVVGMGQVGGRVAVRARQFGMTVLASDAPRFAAGTLPEHVPMLDAIRDADVVSVHVPLTDQGPFATRGLLHLETLVTMRSDQLFINAARGAVVPLDALVSSHCDLVLDVFPHEPVICDALLARAWRISPHIAGHSVEGKVRGTRMIVESLCAHLKMDMPAFDEAVFCAQIAPRPSLPSEAAKIAACCPMGAVDQALRTAMAERPMAERGEAFDAVRRAYVLRRESVVDF